MTIYNRTLRDDSFIEARSEFSTNKEYSRNMQFTVVHLIALE